MKTFCWAMPQNLRNTAIFKDTRSRQRSDLDDRTQVAGRVFHHTSGLDRMHKLICVRFLSFEPRSCTSRPLRLGSYSLYMYLAFCDLHLCNTKYLLLDQ